MQETQRGTARPKTPKNEQKDGEEEEKEYLTSEFGNDN